MKDTLGIIIKKQIDLLRVIGIRDSQISEVMNKDTTLDSKYADLVELEDKAIKYGSKISDSAFTKRASNRRKHNRFIKEIDAPIRGF